MYNSKSMLERIKKEKRKKGYTNDDLAIKTDIPISTLSKVLAGITKEPPVTTIIKIAIALDVSADYLIFGQETANNALEKSSIYKKYNKLNNIGKEKADIYISDLLDNPKYTNESNLTKNNGKNISNKLHRVPTFEEMYDEFENKILSTDNLGDDGYIHEAAFGGGVWKEKNEVDE